MARDGERGRGDWKARSGSHNSGPYAEASGDTGPVDITAVRRDDALIEAISGDGPVQTGTAEEYQLAALLANWRAEIHAEPMPAGPDLDAVVAAVNQEIGARQARISSAHSGGRLRLLRAVTGAAAAIALIVGGLTAFSYGAGPGDPLWGLKEVVFSEQAQSTVVKLADDDLAQAQTYIQQGQPELAAPYMERAASNVDQVNDNGKRDDLLDRWKDLLAQLPPAVQATVTNPSQPVTTPAATTGPKDTAGTTVPNQGGGTTTSVDPRILGDPTDPNTDGTTPGGSTGGVTTLPVTPPVVTTPPVEPSDPATPPTGGPISTAPNTGAQTGAPEVTVPPGGVVPTVDKPVTIVPTQNSLPTGGFVPPTVPNLGGTP
ncbi:anti-sigma-D factor RsdA [Nocardia huaxiensis]|uniref:Anti-sigma-D factor RsdA sigma factor binding region domain-containing protein n=1 Tax=Nocardia huaxiensis TaxID=2755382 RepID=A0A7D6VAT8_9NOCA|nr:anti-sigma-D factor RsdA [Nocardia huaxiensis]QLY31941.1 hypothetical protein H0264_06470 [Nocardia huaxiensis]UFS95510.1 hypothetical protein LPY97_33350 [Nocardia huaxiensis]